MKAGRGSPFTDVNKDVASVATLPSPALPASHMSCIQAGDGGWGTAAAFLRSQDHRGCCGCLGCWRSYFCRLSLEAVQSAAAINRN